MSSAMVASLIENSALLLALYVIFSVIKQSPFRYRRLLPILNGLLIALICVIIMLLGQNVNSYGDEGEESFPRLLTALDKLGVPRIRFMTSHPKDLSDGLIEAMAKGSHICNHLHLPIQSGNDDILRAMFSGVFSPGDRKSVV